MPQLIVTERAALGLERCQRFLSTKSPAAANRAQQTILRRLNQLEANPAIGRPYPSGHGLRELVIGFGDSGYVALYRHDVGADTIYLVAFRHQKEGGY